MTVDRIKIFVDAVRLGSFHKAADKYFYTPSALSHIADAIEKELGVKLLERSAGGIRLTKDGEALFPHLERIAAERQELLAAADGLKKRRTELTVGCYSSISKHLLPDIISAFQAKYPHIRISVVVGNNLNELWQKNAEVCFVSESEREGFPFLPVYTDEYVAVAKAGVFPKKKLLSREEIATQTFLLPDDWAVKHWFGDASEDVTRVSSADDGVILSMVRNGLGISILPYLAVKNHPREVQILKIQPAVTRTLGLVYNEKSSPAVKKLLTLLQR